VSYQWSESGKHGSSLCAEQVLLSPESALAILNFTLELLPFTLIPFIRSILYTNLDFGCNNYNLSQSIKICWLITSGHSWTQGHLELGSNAAEILFMCLWSLLQSGDFTCSVLRATFSLVCSWQQLSSALLGIQYAKLSMNNHEKKLGSHIHYSAI
jgi:hypothetical protein